MSNMHTSLSFLDIYGACLGQKKFILSLPRFLKFKKILLSVGANLLLAQTFLLPLFPFQKITGWPKTQTNPQVSSKVGWISNCNIELEQNILFSNDTVRYKIKMRSKFETLIYLFFDSKLLFKVSTKSGTTLVILQERSWPKWQQEAFCAEKALL